MLQYNLDNEDGDLKIELEGDLDIEATELFKQVITPMIGEYSHVNINMSKVPFVDSSGMGLLIELVRSTETSNTRVTISDVRQEVFEVFELLQLPEILGNEVFV